MSKFTFKFEEQTVSTGNKQITVEFNAISLNSVLNELTDFLKGCGYHINGHLDVVNDFQEPSKIDPLDPDSWPSQKNTPPFSYSELPPSSVSPLTKEQIKALTTHSIEALSSANITSLKPTISTYNLADKILHHPV